MKMMRYMFVFILSACSMQPSYAADLVVAVSLFGESEEAKAQMTGLLQFLTSLEPGRQAVLIDGDHLQTLGTFTVPESAAYRSPKARLNVNKKLAGRLMRLHQNAKTSPQRAAKLPQLLRHIAQSYGGQGALDVIVLGSPFYNDPKEPGYAFAGGRYPSDAHIAAGRGETPFGTRGLEGILENVRVHIGYGGEDAMQSGRYRYFVERFWSLYIAQLGGALASFTGDHAALFAAVKRGGDFPKETYTLKKGGVIEMIRLEPPVMGTSIYERPVTAAPLPPHVIAHARDVEIGLSWSCTSCDLDLYARAFSDVHPLYFGRTETPEGRYYKDFRRSPIGSKGYETIRFSVPVDVREVFIAVNFYGGEAKEPVTAELRLTALGRTYAHKFPVKAKAGNKGKGMVETLITGRAANAHIAVIDPLSIIGISEEEGAQ